VVIAYVPSARAQSAPAADDLCVPVVDRAVLLLADAGGGWRLPTLADASGVTDIAPVGTMYGRPVWAAAIPSALSAEVCAAAGLVQVDWTACADQPDPDLRMLAARAIAVTTWRRTHRYCGACRTELANIDWAVGRTCPSCGLFTYAKAQPVALIAVWRISPTGRREVLLARHTYGAKHLWALVGGFVDPAESFEQAAHREVAEEVGLRVTGLTYFDSQAWGINGPDVLLAVYTARSVDQYAEPVVDGHELAEAHFFPVDDLPDPTPPAHLIAGRALSHLAALPTPSLP
jgi:NAD+ diphosphatase